MNREELLRVIDHSANSGRTTLDLGGQGLSALPSEIGRLTHLTTLLLHNNQLKTLPPELAKLTSLQVLGLGGNPFEQLPREVLALNNLTELYLDGNRLTRLPPEMGQLTRLRKLDLARNLLSSLPPEIHRWTDLRFLGLGSNHLDKLPREIGQLENLEELYLDRNHLTALPPEMFRLRNLTTLYIGANPLRGLPPELGNLDRLQQLDLSNLSLLELPPAVTRLENLTILYLDNNRLSAFPSEIGRLTKLETLFAGRNGLTRIPPEIGRLTSLQKLGLASNQLTELPNEIGDLRSLRKLYLDRNRLTNVPETVGRLANLRTLDLAVNNLGNIPKEIGNLDELRKLGLGTNRLKELPPEIGRLRKLEELYLDSNRLVALPPEVGQLTELKALGLGSNLLHRLPEQLGRLTSLMTLHVDNNPLDDPLRRLAERGLVDLLTYLRSLADVSEPLHEAKLVFIGEGGVGKTSLLAALRGEPFLENRPTTHGIEIHAFHLPYPDGQGVPPSEKEITFNAWDFGGQPIYRVTHQFFFSKRSLYLLLWSPRLGVEQCDVEGWIKRIRLRVGDGAKILIVATHCRTGGRIARIDEGHLRREYRDNIAGFHEVDSKEGVGVDELRVLIAQTATGLPQMGEPFNVKWKAARDEVLGLQRSTPHIRYADFEGICRRHGLVDGSVRTLADLMHDLGHIVYFGDDEGLSEEIVLQPEWLTKAIGLVLEDRETNERFGILEHSRLRKIWHDQVLEGEPRYDPALHPFFLRLMEKYDVSYRLEGGTSSLVAQLVPANRPDLPWTLDAPLSAEEAQLNLVCEMDEEAPGLVPWMIVRTHPFTTQPRRYWQKGMFLQDGPHGTALLELRDREFFLAVRAAWPTYFMDVLHHTVEQLIRDRWPGLYRNFAVPCSYLEENARTCRGRFPLEILLKLKRQDREEVTCLQCGQLYSVDGLLTGFGLSDLREKMSHLETVVTRVEAITTKSASQAAAWYRLLLTALTSQTRECPRLFTLLTEDLNPLNPANLGQTGYRLTLWCEMPGNQHPTCPIGSGGEGEYVFRRPKEWLVKLAPYARLVARTLKIIVPIAVAGVEAAVDESLLKNIDQKLKFMETVTETLLKGESEPGLLRHEPEKILKEEEGAGLRELHSLLDDLDRTKRWGQLNAVVSPAHGYLWLCPHHHRVYDPGLPRLP
jgi:Leucine-rich repeat (LRR) protein